MSGSSRVLSLWLSDDLIAHIDHTAQSAGISRNAYARGVLESASGFRGGSDLLRDHSPDGVVVE